MLAAPLPSCCHSPSIVKESPALRRLIHLIPRAPFLVTLRLALLEDRADRDDHSNANRNPATSSTLIALFLLLAPTSRSGVSLDPRRRQGCGVARRLRSYSARRFFFVLSQMLIGSLSRLASFFCKETFTEMATR